MRLFITSNSAWVVPAAVDDRRFFVLDVSDSKAQNHEYFAQLHDEMQNGGSAALLHYLLNYDYKDVNLRLPPQTAALIEQKLETMDTFGKFLFLSLDRGHYHPQGASWPEYVETTQFFNLCHADAKKNGMMEKSLSTKMGMGLKKYLGDIKKVKANLPGIDPDTGMTINTAFGVHKLQQTVYLFPPLSECRKRFTQVTGIPFTGEETPE